MKLHAILLTTLILTATHTIAREDVTIVAPSSEAAQGLDLMAVSEIFKDTKDLEEFEYAINHPDTGVNNLDLDHNGEVDFIRVVEEIVGDSHIIILQAAIGVDEFQDVATIEVEKSADNYKMHIHGNEIIYGPSYYIAPSHVHIHTWPIIAWIYRPVYRPFRSTYYFGYYPRWWKPFRPLSINVYRSRTVTFTNRNTFVVTKTRRVKPVTRVVYKPSSSTKVTRSLHVNKTTHANGATTKSIGVKKTKTKADGTKVTTKKGVKKTTNKNTGNSTVTKGKKRTKTDENGNKKSVKKTKRTSRKRDK